MSFADPLAALEVKERNELEALLLDFDGSWAPESFEGIAGRVASHPSQQYSDLALSELVKIDLQRCWSAGDGRMLEEYLQQCPALGTTETVDADLVVAEFEARSNVHADLVLASYESRFPKQFPLVQQLVSELTESSVKESSPNPTEPNLVQASIDTSRIDSPRDTKDGKKRDTALELPVEFGRYRILKELGAGAMGKVYLAHDSQLERQVALKTPNFSGSGDDDMVTRFYREARAAAKIHHRNICPIYDVGEIDGRHFITMAFIKGRCMSEFIKPDRLPPQRTSAILVQRLAVALAEAHKHNVIHRDLKPANIMIDLKKEPVVMDFGLARQMDVESRVTQSGMAVGTPAYMSPEQIRGELHEVGTAADIYALGVILYELLTGQLPFLGPIAKVVYGIVNETPAPPSQLREDIDRELESICAKMMAKNRLDRYSSMGEVAAELKAYLKGRRKTAQANSATPGKPAASVSSGEHQLTETDALNAFFAAQTDSNSRGTMVEPAARSTSAAITAPKMRTSQLNRNNGGRKPLIASGFAGGAAVLLGVVIYFNGGKVVLDSDSNAVVKVDDDGSVAIRTGPELKPSDKNSTTSAAKASIPSKASIQAFNSSFDPKVELVNEWDHGAPNASNWHLATLSPDGKQVAFRLREGPLIISDCESKQSLDIPIEMENAISLAFSSDGRLIVTGHEDKTIRLWNAETFEQKGEPFESPIEPSVPWVHLSADGTKLIALANDHAKLKGESTFLTWEISTRKLISRFQAGVDDQRLADSIDASADGRLVAVISLRSGPTLWDTMTGKQVPVEFEYDEQIAGMKRIAGMDLSADGSRLAYGTVWGAASFAAILDTSTGKELWNSGPQKGRVHCVQFTNDGQWFASTAGRDGGHQLSLWDVQSGSEIERWTYQHRSESENADRVKFLSFSDNGTRLLLTGGYMPVVVWNLFEKAAIDLKSEAEAAATRVKATRMAETSPDDREIAEQFVDFGGGVQLAGSGKWIWTLPDGEIRVEGVSFFRKQKEFDDGHIALLEQLPDLQTVVFYPNQMTNEGIATLAEMPNVVENVKHLVFNRIGLGPKGLAALAKLKRLETLTLHQTDLINDDLKLLANFQALRELTLEQESKKKFGPAFLTDDCLKHLMAASSLRKLTLNGETFTDECLIIVADLTIEELWLGTPNVTDQAVAKLREQRPRLGITRFKQSITEL
ncbi:protein kinase domain-containing protein [Planctomycetaceae bacterium SH139]